jgi:16S rRNA processing protein RimM
VVDSFVAGVVGAPFGVKGFVKVHVPSGETEHLETLENARLRQNGAERNYAVEDVGGSPSSFVMKFRGVDTPEAAKLLAGAELIVPRNAAAPLDEDEFYVEDLRGVSVILLPMSGAVDKVEVVGEIVDVLEGGGGQLAEIKLGDGSRRLVPFRNEFFGDIDLEARTAVLRERWMLE